MPMKNHVICVGIAVQDHVFGLSRMPVAAEKYRAQSLEIVGGGIAANAAVAIARLGGRASLATRLGDDSTGRDIVTALEAEGVECALARRFAGIRSSQSAVLVDAAGERIVINYADPQLPDDTGWLPDVLPATAGCVLGDTRWESGALHFFKAARAAQAIAVLDGDRAVTQPVLLAAATHLVFAAQAVREMTGHDDPAAGLLALSIPETIWVAATDGVRGTHVRVGRRVETWPAFPVMAVDTLAAGDVFHGAFALALAEKMGEHRAVQFAAAVAAIKCTRFGGRAGTPTRSETEEFLKGHAL
ncbi:MAG: PfkB family carbohydrate kinase [Beijerinckiaceae bacterium]